MSSILNALKKAQHEQRPRSVPVVSMRDLLEGAGAKPRPWRWVALACLLAAGSLSVWLWGPSFVSIAFWLGPQSSSMGQPADRLDRRPAEPPETLASRVTAPRGKRPAQQTPKDSGTLRTSMVKDAAKDAPTPAADSSLAEAERPAEDLSPRSRGRQPGPNLSGSSTPASGQPVLHLSGPVEHLSPPSLRAEREELATAREGSAAPTGVEPPPAAPARPATAEPRGPSDVPPAKAVEPTASASGPPSLRAAVEKMHLSVHVYAEDQADRLVYIDGRRYVEGQTVQGGYLLERITPEGAFLVFEGERLLLRRKPVQYGNR